MSVRWPDPEFEADLRRLLRLSRKASQEPFQVPPGTTEVEVPLFGSGMMRSTPRAFVRVLDDDMPLFRSLQRRLTGSARKRSGLSPDEADAVLMEACVEAVAGRIKDGVASVLDTLAEKPGEWVITEPVDLLLPAANPRLVVGRTTYSTRPPRLMVEAGFAQRQRFIPPFATTRVVSRGSVTARVLARHAFAESAAILDLIARPGNTGSEATAVRRASDRTAGPAFSRTGLFVRDDMISGTRLASPFVYLSRAAGRDDANRSDWQRRVLAATRWLSRAHRSEWAADRLVSAMVALESLFIAGERHKGDLIAKRLTARFHLKGETESDQIAWLSRLYQDRNKAAHEGREVVDDLEVDRLLDLTHTVVRVSAFHLDPDHRDPRRACRTYAQALRCHKPF